MHLDPRTEDGSPPFFLFLFDTTSILENSSCTALALTLVFLPTDSSSGSADPSSESSLEFKGLLRMALNDVSNTHII